MRLVAALTIMLLVAVMGVTAVQEVRSHRKVLADGPSAVNETVATIVKGLNATKAANATGNATDARSRRGRGGDGWGGGTREPIDCGSISCKKRRLMAANETSAANATAVNGTNVTGNSSDTRSRRGFNEGADSYSRPGTYNTFTQADQVAATLGLGGNKRLLAESQAAATEALNATAAGNATGNATDNRAREGGGDGWGGGNSGSAPVCFESIACKKRRLMAANQTSAANATAANSTNVTGNSSDTRSRRGFNEGADSYSGPGTYNTFTQADQVAATLGLGGGSKRLLAEPAAASHAMNATAGGNATGNATDNRSRRGGEWYSGNAPVCESISCLKRRLMAANQALNATAAGNATGNATDNRSRRSNGPGEGGSRSGYAEVCESISCLKRKLMQATNVSTTDLATTDGMEPAINSNASALNATHTNAMNATGNSTDSRSRVGGLGRGNDWGEGNGPAQPRTEFGV